MTIAFDLSEEAVDIFSLGILGEPEVYDLAHDSILIGEVMQAVNYNDKIALLDNAANRNSVIIVDKQSRSMRHIQRTGRGPEEYLGLTLINVDTNRDLLYAYSRQSNKLLYFDAEGEMQHGIAMPKQFQYVWPIEEGYVGDMGNYGADIENRDNLWIMDGSFTLQDSYFEIPESWESSSYSSYIPFSTYDKKAYFTKMLDNNVYVVSDEDVSAAFRFDFGKHNWPEPEAGYERWREIQQQTLGRYVHGFQLVQETDKYIIVLFLHEGQNRLGVYDKETQESKVCFMGSCTGKYFLPFGKIIGMDQDAIYTTVEAYRIKRLWNGRDEYNDFEASYPDQIRRLREDFPELKEDGNPFIMVYPFNPPNPQ
jgi:hypothetical protein